MTKHEKPTILIIIGITGDLSRRKLLPALAHLAGANALPEKFRIIGVSRQTIDMEALTKGLSKDDKSFLTDHIERVSFHLADTDSYKVLTAKIAAIEQEFGEQAEKLFYLSVPPGVSRPLIEHLGRSGIAKMPGTKLLLEKPFGMDEVSAEELVGHIEAHFSAEQVYRIDHYIAKEMAQNIIVFRQGNSLFKRTWNSQFIESIDVIASEKIGIEGRAHFYEQTGALRDVVQSHLLQLAALVLMDLPGSHSLGNVPQARLEALQALLPANPAEAMRAQYEEYADEVENPASLVETFVSLTLFSRDPRWSNTPIRLTTGKALHAKYTEIRINYHKTADHESNELIFRLQPHEGVEVVICVKEPGFDRRVERQPLHFTYDHTAAVLPDAYEHVLLDAMRTDHSLFTTSEEVLASWRVLQPLLDGWTHDNDIRHYPRGAAPETIVSRKSGPLSGNGDSSASTAV